MSKLVAVFNSILLFITGLSQKGSHAGGRWTQVSRDSVRVARALRGEALARSLPQCRPPRVAAQ